MTRSLLLAMTSTDLYERVTLPQVASFLFAVLYDLLATVPLLVLLETVVVLALYVIFVFPFDLLRSRYLQSRIFSTRLRSNLVQDAANRLVRFAFKFLDYRIGSQSNL